MIEAFKRGEDIHASTAAQVNDVPLDKVTKTMRRNAKAINFGVIYGMGVNSLARSTGMSTTESRDFIDKYFTLFKGVKEYIEKSIDQARERGYAETLFGRRRYLPEIESQVQMLRAAAERMAQNMPLQGTAADLMKMAMIKLDQKFLEDDNVRMILQVHDELVFEIKNNQVKKTAFAIKKTMEDIHKFKIPITVDVSVGEDWQDLSLLNI